DLLTGYAQNHGTDLVVGEEAAAGQRTVADTADAGARDATRGDGGGEVPVAVARDASHHRVERRGFLSATVRAGGRGEAAVGRDVFRARPDEQHLLLAQQRGGEFDRMGNPLDG